VEVVAQRLQQVMVAQEHSLHLEAGLLRAAAAARAVGGALDFMRKVLVVAQAAVQEKKTEIFQVVHLSSLIIPVLKNLEIEEAETTAQMVHKQALAAEVLVQVLLELAAMYRRVMVIRDIRGEADLESRLELAGRTIQLPAVVVVVRVMHSGKVEMGSEETVAQMHKAGML
jgi:ribosomal protein L30E